MNGFVGAWCVLPLGYILIMTGMAGNSMKTTCLPCMQKLGDQSLDLSGSFSRVTKGTKNISMLATSMRTTGRAKTFVVHVQILACISVGRRVYTIDRNI